MITKKQMEKAGYTVLKNGGHIVMSPADLTAHEWEVMCESFEVDPQCKEMVLCVCGVIEVPFKKENEDE